VTIVTMSLFQDVVERHLVDEIRIVAIGLSSIITRNWNLAKKFHSHGVVRTLRRFILLQGSKAPQATVTSCVELLFQLLVILDESMAMMDEGTWTDIASQVTHTALIGFLICV
jgi:membrane-associated HD superfamily phosphohydrolase